jgi:KDO2-lipid IV(A) lauroyltransferase
MYANVRHQVEYLAVRLAVCQLCELPVRASLALAEGMGLLAYHVLGRRRRAGRENLAAAFPEKSPCEIDSLLRSVYRNLFRTIAEIFQLRRRARPCNWRDFVEIDGLDRAIDVLTQGRGCILVTGHLGNWEFLGHVLSHIGIRSRVLARPLDNPLLDRYILGVRESGLQRIVLKRGSGDLVEKTLAEGGFVSILVDQDAGRKGVFVPFFGRPASTWRSTALLSQTTGAPILPGCCVRTGGPLKFRVIVGRPIYPDAAADVSAETLRITADFTGQLESWIRQRPEQYLWLHRRWKTAPAARSLVLQGGR